MTKQVQYDADEKAAGRARGTVTIGAHKYHPVKRSGKLMKRLIEMTPDTPTQERDAEGNLVPREPTKEESAEGIDLVYGQLSLLLEDEQKQNPDADFLQEELDFEDAQELVRDLSPRPPREAQPSG